MIRDRNLKFIVARYQKLLPSAKITIVEQNTESDLSDLNVTHILRTMEPFDYSRGYGFNEGAKVTDGDYIIFSDNDIMLHEDLLKNFEKLVNGYDFFIPSQKFLNISRDGTKKVLSGEPLDSSWLERNRPRVADNGAGDLLCLGNGSYEVYGWEPSIGSWYPDELMRSKVNTFNLKMVV